MERLWKVFTRPKAERAYDFSRLVDSLYYDNFDGVKFPIQFICDIDKTYLETQFESIIKMARVALESANAKVTVSGAAEVLMSLRWGESEEGQPMEGFPRPIHFVSSSPPQLRPVLEEKLCQDGLDWTSDTFKNQAYNVIKVRMDQLKQHVGYKTAAILRVVKSASPKVRFVMFGDNAESDAFIYLGVALKLSGVLNPDAYTQYLIIGGLESSVARDISKAYADIGEAHVDGIYIRNAPGYKFIGAPELTQGVTLFDDYFQLTTMMALQGLVPAASLPTLTRNFHNRYGFSSKRLLDHLFVLRQQESLSPALAEQVNKSIALLTDQAPPASATMNFLHQDLAYLQKLTEGEALNIARDWSAAMHQEKSHRRKSKRS